MKNKKIVFVISTLNTGGAQRILSNLVSNAPNDWEIRLLLNDTEDIVYPYKGNIIDLGIKSQRDKESLRYQAKVFVKRYIKLRELKKKGDISCVVSILESANIVNVISGKKQCPIIAYVHSNLSQSAIRKAYKYLVNPIEKYTFKHFDYIVGVSQGVCDDLKKNHGCPANKTTAILNGYDVKEIREKAEENIEFPERWQKSNNRLIAVGRLDGAKAFWHLIRAFREVKKKVPDSVLLVLGEGEDKEYLKSLSEKLGIQEDVVFMGFIKNPFPYIKGSRALVVSSVFEGFPNSIAETLCLGVPCVSTDIESGPRELLAPDTPFDEHIREQIEITPYGILTPKCDGIRYDEKVPPTREELLLAEGICKLLLDYTLYDSIKKNIPERVATLDVSNMVGQWHQLIDKLDRNREG